MSVLLLSAVMLNVDNTRLMLGFVMLGVVMLNVGVLFVIVKQPSF